MTLGYLSHLVLDEIWSVEWTHGLHLKNSFGTALKFFGHGTLGATYRATPSWRF